MEEAGFRMEQKDKVTGADTEGPPFTWLLQAEQAWAQWGGRNGDAAGERGPCGHSQQPTHPSLLCPGRPHVPTAGCWLRTGHLCPPIYHLRTSSPAYQLCEGGAAHIPR